MNKFNKTQLEDIYKTLTNYGVLTSMFLALMFCLITTMITELELVVTVKPFLISMTILLTVIHLMLLKDNYKAPFFKKYIKVIQTLIVVTSFEVLYIFSYSSKMMIPDGLIESILIVLPIFKFCIYVYVVTLNRISNENKCGEDYV